jgi:hypothetical protein
MGSSPNQKRDIFKKLLTEVFAFLEKVAYKEQQNNTERNCCGAK